MAPLPMSTENHNLNKLKGVECVDSVELWNGAAAQLLETLPVVSESRGHVSIMWEILLNVRNLRENLRAWLR